MKLLIDTHVLLWIAGDSENLSKKVASLVLDEENSLFLSFAQYLGNPNQITARKARHYQTITRFNSGTMSIE